MLERVEEPEVMDTAEEARDYDAMDHAEVNRSFCDDFLRFVGVRSPSRVADFGTGTARIPIELCGRDAGLEVVALDLAAHMLALAAENVALAGLTDRVRLERIDAKGTAFEDGAFAATIANSVVHHIPSPARTFAEMWRVTARGGTLFVRDLRRPATTLEVERLVSLHGGEAPEDPRRLPAFERQRALFRASLRAALTAEEVALLVAPLGIPAAAVRVTSDRHWTVACVKP
jgi:ubiquinone/menaquinone biosynthesis C-methylase UbiE